MQVVGNPEADALAGQLSPGTRELRLGVMELRELVVELREALQVAIAGGLVDSVPLQGRPEFCGSGRGRSPCLFE